MFITIVAILCSLTIQGSCVEEIVTDSNMDPDVTFQGCQIYGQAGIAKWMSESPLYHSKWRLDSWKCIPGHYEIRGRV